MLTRNQNKPFYGLKIFSKKLICSRRGFTLIELSIVFGIVIIVFGAIWLAMGQVNSKRLLSQTADAIWEISQNVRSAYTGQTGIIFPSTVNEQVAAGLFPAYILSGTPPAPRTPLGGAISLTFDRTTTPWQFTIIVSFTGPAAINISNCVNLISRIPPTAQGESGGPVDVIANGGTSLLGLNLGAVATALGANCTQLRFVFNF